MGIFLNAVVTCLDIQTGRIYNTIPEITNARLIHKCDLGSDIDIFDVFFKIGA